MQLSLHADYALRYLIYLGAHPERLVTTQEVSEAYGISRHHLVRVVQTLVEHGYVASHTGRSGGARLAMEPKQIRLGQVIRDAEPNMRLVECFDGETNTCRIVSACALKGMLAEAMEGFINSLNRYNLDDILRDNSQKLVSIFTAISA